MNASQRNQLKAVDRALLALLDERARLLEQVDEHDPARRAAVDDMLRRHTGPVSAAAIRAIFGAIDVHAASSARGES
ncbi:MAG: hypothetical protein ACKVWV_04295 [Planctomycetota bacterium]